MALQEVNDSRGGGTRFVASLIFAATTKHGPPGRSVKKSLRACGFVRSFSLSLEVTRGRIFTGQVANDSDGALKFRGFAQEESGDGVQAGVAKLGMIVIGQHDHHAGPALL